MVPFEKGGALWVQLEVGQLGDQGHVPAALKFSVDVLIGVLSMYEVCGSRRCRDLLNKHECA